MKKLFLAVSLLVALSNVSSSVARASLVKETSGALLIDDFNRADNSDMNSGLPVALWATSHTGDGGGIHSIEIKNGKLRIYATGGNRCDPDNPGCHNNGDWPVVTSIGHSSDAVLEYDMTIQIMGGGSVAHHEEFYTYFRFTGVDHGYAFGYDHWPYGSWNWIKLTKPAPLWNHQTVPELDKTNWVHSIPQTYSNRILFDGASIQVWSDDSPIFSVTDPSYFASGSIGFGQYTSDGFGGVNQGEVYYDNVRVYLVPANNPVKIKVDTEGLIVEAYTLGNNLIDTKVADLNGDVLLDFSSLNSFPASARIVVKENGNVIFEEVIIADRVDGVYPGDVWTLSTYTASYTPTPPTIDGVIDPVEWQDANRYDLQFQHYNLDEWETIPAYFINDGTWLYFALSTPFPTHWENYCGVGIDGDHSHTCNGQLSEPYTDIGYNKAGSTSPRYWFYDAYWSNGSPCGNNTAVTPPAGTDHAFSGTTALSYEFKISLADLTVSPGGTVGFMLRIGTNGTTPGDYNFPYFDQHLDIANWPDLQIAGGEGPATGVVQGNVYVISLQDGEQHVCPNAEVRAQGPSGSFTFYTDETGFYIERIPVGTYTLTASTPFYDQEASQGVSISEEGTEERNFQLEPHFPTVGWVRPDQSEVVSGWEEKILIHFSKEMDIESLRQNLRVMRERDNHEFSTVVEQSVFNPRSYWVLEAKPSGESEPIYFGYAEEILVEIGAFAQDLSGNKLDGSKDGFYQSWPFDNYGWTFSTSDIDLNPIFSRALLARQSIESLYADYTEVYARHNAYMAESVFDFLVGQALTGAFWASRAGKWVLRSASPLQKTLIDVVVESFESKLLEDFAGRPVHEVLEEFFLNNLVYEDEILPYENTDTPESSVKRQYRGRLQSFYLEFTEQLNGMHSARQIKPEAISLAQNHLDEMINENLGFWRDRLNSTKDYLADIASTQGQIDEWEGSFVERAAEEFQTCYVEIFKESEQAKIAKSSCIDIPLRFQQAGGAVIVGELAKTGLSWAVAVPAAFAPDLLKIDQMDDEFEFYYRTELEAVEYILKAGTLPTPSVAITDPTYEEDCFGHLEVGATVVNTGEVSVVVRAFYDSKEPIGFINFVGAEESLDPILLEAGQSYPLDKAKILQWSEGKFECTIVAVYGIDGLDPNYGYGSANKTEKITISYESQEDDRLVCRVHSPVDVHLWDPLGRHTGMDYLTDEVHRHVPWSFYSGASAEPETIVVVNPVATFYEIQVLPEPDAEPIDSFTLEVLLGGVQYVLAENQRVADLPQDCYRFWTIPVGSISGTVSDCLGGLLDVAVDLFDSAGALAQFTDSDSSGFFEFDSVDAGEYTMSIVTPLGYVADFESRPITVTMNGDSVVDFTLHALEIVPSQRSMGYWKHQVNVHLSGKGTAEESPANMSNYMSLIGEHFNNNPTNPITIFDVPQPATQTDSLEALQDLLTAKGNAAMNARAKQQLIAVLLNVVSLKAHQTTAISEDGATVSQAITYCNELITDCDPSNDEIAKDMADNINNGMLIASAVIPLSTPNIAYKGTGEESVQNENLPKQFSLAQNCPNPFNPETEISYTLSEAAQVKVSVYNMLGQKVRTLVNEYQAAGHKTISWDGTDEHGNKAASGIYFYRVKAGEFEDTKKMILMK
ncbi:MAG: FlgD immunoglobulin-like domain containing protein [Candidatus Zixiibacteriota bacterium]